MQVSRPADARRLPAGFRAVALGSRADFCQAIALIVRSEPDPVAGYFIVLRNDSTATVYLGCLTDESGAPTELLQIWVQTTSVSGSVGQMKAVPNAALDARWKALWNATYDANPTEFILSGYETRPAHPLLLDPKGGVMLDLAQKGEWELCTDDAVLAAAQLPPYSNSNARFLFQRKQGSHSQFMRVAGEIEEGERSTSLEAIVPSANGLAAFNVACGFILVSRSYPLDADEFTDLLSGRIALANQISDLSLPAALQPLGGIDGKRIGAGAFFTQLNGGGARFAEIFHLKILLLAEMFELTRHSVEMQKAPFLNLGMDSFRVRFGAEGFGLPFLWSAQVTLNRPGEAFPLKVAQDEAAYFIFIGAPETTIFRPQGVAMHLRAVARNVSIRRVAAADAGRHVMDGTIRTDEPLIFSEQDLLGMEIPFQTPTGIMRLPVHARLSEEQGRSAGEYSFRSLAFHIPESLVAALTKTDRFAATFHRVPFEIIPMLSTPIDLYSLAIISLRILVGNSRNNLGDVVDRVESLISHLENSAEKAADLPSRIAGAFGVSERGDVSDENNRFVQVLGPQNLLEVEMSAAEAFQLLPARLWFETLAMVLRSFPGRGVENICKDYGDASPQALERVFERPLEDLEAIALKSRSLVMVDWTMTREIQSVLNEFAD
jgi:hypothetical protein